VTGAEFPVFPVFSAIDFGAPGLSVFE